MLKEKTKKWKKWKNC